MKDQSLGLLPAILGIVVILSIVVIGKICHMKDQRSYERFNLLLSIIWSE